MTQQVTNRQLRGMYDALKVLGNRRMATPAADLKVGRAIRVLGPLAEPITAARQRIVTDAVDGVAVAELSPLAQQRLNASVQQQQQALDAEVVEVSLAAFVLTAADLPKEMPGDDGWKNCAQLGAIVADLGALYPFHDIDVT